MAGVAATGAAAAREHVQLARAGGIDAGDPCGGGGGDGEAAGGDAAAADALGTHRRSGGRARSHVGARRGVNAERRAWRVW